MRPQVSRKQILGNRMTYDELREVIADFANRQDLQAQIPLFIKLTAVSYTHLTLPTKA